MKYTQEIFDKLIDTINVDLKSHYNDFIDFISNDHKQIIDFYSGNSVSLEHSVTDKLQKLILKTTEILNSISLNKEAFETIEFWEVCDDLENMKIKLQTITQTAKYLRSSISKGVYNTQTISGVNLDFNQSLVRKFNDNLEDVAVFNDLAEENYTSKGGIILQTKLNNIQNPTNITTVVDSLIGEKMYGLDIFKKITFENDDVKVCSYKETVSQAIDILINLNQGDNPEYPEDGKTPNLIGSNINSMQFPVLFRQLSDLFTTDDTLSGFAVTDIKVEKDSTYINYEINTKYNETISKQIKI
jgi:hypothetical protein